ncbi:MAG: hypothetical protein IT292_09145 [Deltaproteobacteria bacterium]|nr:hypothetical protein [Deltaproteobacteria bacterium]
MSDVDDSRTDDEQKEVNIVDGYVEVDESYVRRLAEQDDDRPRLRPFFIACGIFILICLFWMIASIDSLYSNVTPLIDKFSQQLSSPKESPRSTKTSKDRNIDNYRLIPKESKVSDDNWVRQP